jgi:hypothetical protein
MHTDISAPILDRVLDQILLTVLPLLNLKQTSEIKRTEFKLLKINFNNKRKKN